MNLLQVDYRIFFLLNHLPHSHWLDLVAKVVHISTRGGLIYYPIFILLALTTEKRQLLGRLTIFSMLVTYAINDFVLKNIFGRMRPSLVLHDVYFVLPRPTGYSFPSGQAAIGATVAMMCLLFFPKKLLAYAMVVFALIVGLDRVYMGHHFPSDVLAGWMVGSFISWVVYELWRRWQKPNPPLA